MNNNPIGLFDSGVGGLSVLLEIKKLLPRESYVFLADQLHNPYGAKTKKQLENLAGRITKFLLSHDIKLLVVACNTATCYALDYLRANFTVPIVGVVPAIKPAAVLSKTGKIAVMSTPATAKSAYLSKLITQYAPNSQVLKLGCDGLEESIEYLDQGKIDELVRIYAQKISSFGSDVIVLGCTHFPFIKDRLQKKIRNVQIIDSGQAIARRVNDMLTESNLLATTKSEDLYYTTADPQKFAKVSSILLGTQVTAQKTRI